MSIRDIVLDPAPNRDASPGDVVYQAGQRVEVNGVPRTVAVDAVVSADKRVDVWLVPDLVFGPDIGSKIDLGSSNDVAEAGNRYVEQFQRGEFVVAEDPQKRSDPRP